MNYSRMYTIFSFFFLDKYISTFFTTIISMSFKQKGFLKKSFPYIFCCHLGHKALTASFAFLLKAIYIIIFNLLPSTYVEFDGLVLYSAKGYYCPFLCSYATRSRTSSRTCWLDIVSLAFSWFQYWKMIGRA
jgi:hypothetical protein